MTSRLTDSRWQWGREVGAGLAPVLNSREPITSRLTDSRWGGREVGGGCNYSVE